MEKWGVYMLTDDEKREIYNAAFHWRYADGCSWKFCSGILKQNYEMSYTPEQVQAACEWAHKEKYSND